MKNFEIDSFGMQEMTVQETRNTNGGSLTILLACAAAALLLSSCGSGNTFNINLFNGNKAGDADVTVGVDADSNSK